MENLTVKCTECGSLYNTELDKCPRCGNNKIMCPNCYKWFEKTSPFPQCPQCKHFALHVEKIEILKKCKYCGKPSGTYDLCKHCYDLKQQGNIIECPDCGSYYPSDEICLCHIKDEFIFSDKTNCIICNKDSNGYLFCPKCYYKYKNKNIYLKVSNCEKIELLDSIYESAYTCEDGHPVKSQQEALIDNYLFNHNIRHVYEKAFPIDNNKEHDLHPDFFLPDLDVYIEHWGIKNNAKYEETKEYKIPFYQKAKITLICTNSDDITNISANLERKLKFFQRGKINWLE